MDEIFGAPPVLPLSVSWTCAESDPGRGVLRFVAPEGLSGVASDCEMAFAIDGTDSGCDVTLKMSYQPVSPLATVAAPVLAADNALALRVLLRRTLEEDGLVDGSAQASAATVGAPSRLGTMDPIAGPLVLLARRLGRLPEEEADGWNGEPSAWAEADSLPQRLSELTSTRLAGFKQWVAELVAGEFDASAVDARLEREIDGADVVMFSFTSCPFCKRAKELLDAKEAAYTVVELDLEPDGAALRARLGARTGRTSVPSVFIGGEYCGGMNDGPGLGPLDAQGLLVPKLRGAGAIA